MKKIFISLCGILLVVLIITIVKNTMFHGTQAEEQHVSAAALYGSSTPIDIPTESGEKGTETNPFVILEIVPYEGYAEIGYMIQGCEPVPMDQLTFDNTVGGILGSIGGMSYQWKEETTFDVPATDRIGTGPSDWKSAGEFNQYGYFMKVPTGTGNFNVKINNSIVAEFKEEPGDYIWVAAQRNEAGSPPIDEQAGEIYYPYMRKRVKYSRWRNYFTYHNYFAKKVLELSDEQIPNYKITVITITPENLNLSINQPLIDRADLISISPKSHFGTDVLAMWEKYNPSRKITTKTSKQTNGFIDNDLTWETTVELLRKASVDEDIAPIIFDVTVFSGNGVSIGSITPTKKYSSGTSVSMPASGYLNNIAKLYMVMQQMEPAKFYQEYIATNLIKSVPIQIKISNNRYDNLYNGSVKMTTGYYVSQDNSYTSSTVYKKYKTNQSGSNNEWDPNPAAIWSIHTFLPYEMFANWNALDNNKIWSIVGIDNYIVLDGDNANISIRHNLYSYNGNNALTQKFMDQTFIGYNQYRVDAFRYYSMTSGSISPAMAIHFLLNQERPVYSQEVLRILEIEPCNDFIWTGSNAEWVVGSNTVGTPYARQFFTKYFPNYRGKVSITKMTSAEFIGNITDLNATYDMIFFGLKDGLLKKDDNGFTVYNDSTMNKKIYTHNGDLINQSNEKLRGLPGTSSPADTYRYSGNDITLLKLNELKNFMLAGNVVLLDTGFYEENKVNVNKVKIDEHSNIYKLANLNRTTYPQLYYTETVIINQIENVISKSNCKIVFGSTKKTIPLEECYPIIYRDRTLEAYKNYSNSQIYINGSNAANRTLQYKFYIKDDVNSNSTYTVKLYIDINADGKYDETTENVTGLIVQDEYGYLQDYNSLEPMVNYTVTRTLEADYFGVLPWKLEIVSNNSSEGEARDSVINYAALMTQDKNRIQLNVLQIMSNKSGSKETNNVKLTDEPFKTLISKVGDYKINITTKYVNEVDAWCGTDSSKYKYILSDDNDDIGDTDSDDGIDDDKDGIYDFDMLVIGFADCYSDIGNQNTLRNINDFIEEGKTVLFTHDTTSFVNKPQSSYGYTDFWGYSLNKNFRDVFGMDRFGATFQTGDVNRQIADRKAAGKDYASTPNDYSGYIHGYSNMIMDRYSNKNKSSKYINWRWVTTFDYYGSHMNVNFDNIETDIKTKKVTQTNQGQLTEYPFKIEANFDIAETHAQYYQLDLENDDIVVWYCLSDSKASTNNGYYSSTPNDVRNNYYIYNIGNITYSGVGHSTVSGQMEAKLFVNTMIAAYSATAKAAEVVITNKNTSKGPDADYIYVDYDIYNTALAYGSDVKSNVSDQYQRVKFRINDNNILFNKIITLSYYAVNGVNETKLNDIKTYRIRNNIVLENPVIYSGTEYFIDIPLSVLQSYKMTKDQNFGTKIRIKVLVTYGKDSSKTKLSSHDFILARRGLFDLD